MKKIVYLIVFLLLFTPLVSVATAQFYSYTDVPIDYTLAGADYRGSILEYQTIQHSEGKFIYATHGNNLTIIVYIFSPNGNNEAVVLVTAGGTTAIRGLSVMEFDTDEVIIFALAQWSGGQFYASWHRVNINAYTSSSSTNLAITFGAGSGAFGYVGTMFTYDDNFYCLYAGGEADKDVWGLVRYVPATGVQTDAGTYTGATSETAWHHVGFQDSEQYIYTTVSYNPSEQPHYKKCDLDTLTWTDLADHPVTDRWSNSRNFHYIGGGIYEDTGTNYTWLYHTWGYSSLSGTTRLVNLIQHRIVFNGTAPNPYTVIESANIIQSDEVPVIISPSIPTGATETTFIGGYYENGERDQINIYYAVYQSGILRVRRDEWSITDWDDYFNAVFTLDDWEYDTTVPLDDEDENSGRDFAESWQVNELIASDRGRVYYGLPILYATWDITLSWTPADDPLLVNTWYSFRGTLYRNNIVSEGFVIIYADDTQIGTVDVDYTGVFLFSGTTTAGLHNYTMAVYSGGLRVYTESFYLLWATVSGADTEDLSPSQILPYSINSMFAFIPNIILVFVPTMMMASLGGPVGFIAGLGLSVGIGVMGGALPFYYLYLVILLIAMAFIYFAKSDKL